MCTRFSSTNTEERSRGKLENIIEVDLAETE
jgi:hypothetical protein